MILTPLPSELETGRDCLYDYGVVKCLCQSNTLLSLVNLPGTWGPLTLWSE